MSIELPFILKSHFGGRLPGGGRPLLFCPSPNPFLESPHRKFSVARPPLGASQSDGRRALHVTASQFSPLPARPCFPQPATTRLSRSPRCRPSDSAAPRELIPS